MNFQKENNGNKWTKIADFILNPELDIFKNMIKKIKDQNESELKLTKNLSRKLTMQSIKQKKSHTKSPKSPKYNSLAKKRFKKS